MTRSYLNETVKGFQRVEKDGIRYDVVPAFFPHVDYLFCGYRSPLCFKVIRQAKREEMLRSYETVCRASGLPYERVTMTHIVHRSTVLEVGEDMAGRGVFLKEQLPDCDGLITSVSRLPIATTHADCMPVAFYAPDQNMGCVVHAGWRGVLLGIHRKAVSKLAARGCDVKQLLAAIGPCIHACCFEVGDEVVGQFMAAYGHGAWLQKGQGKAHIDLARLVLGDLERAALPPQHVTVDLRCTCCETNDLQSYRRDGKKAGTMVQMMCLR